MRVLIKYREMQLQGYYCHKKNCDIIINIDIEILSNTSTMPTYAMWQASIIVAGVL